MTVALVLVPQSMAYAQLAGLPPYDGLYAAFLPPLVGALFGSSRQLATGPVAVVSLMTATALSPLAVSGSKAYLAYALLLALLVGVFQFLLGVLRLGLVVNFLSHPVINGFTNAAALIIATSQLAKLFGVDVDSASHHYETVYNIISAALLYTHLPTLLIGIFAFLVMFALKKFAPRLPNVLIAVALTTLISWATNYDRDRRCELADISPPTVQSAIKGYNEAMARVDELMANRVALNHRFKEAARSEGRHSAAAVQLQSDMKLLDLDLDAARGRVIAIRADLRRLHFRRIDEQGREGFRLESEVLLNNFNDGRIWRLKVGNRPIPESEIHLSGGGEVVGCIPAGLPSFVSPALNWNIIPDLLSMAVIISLLGFMEAISVARAMGMRTGQLIDANQELIGQGLANIIAAFTRGYPVSGSFSRSAVNLDAGAQTGISSIFSSLLVGATLLFLTPLLYHLPQSVLAAVIMMAVVGLVNFRGVMHAFKAQKYDGTISIVTFISTLAFAPHLDRGIIIGVVLSVGHYLIRNIKPPMAILARYNDGTYRDADRRRLGKCRYLTVFRFNGALLFPNVNYLEEQVFALLAANPEMKHLHIVGNAINELDASGEETLRIIVTRLRERGLDVSFSGLNDAVLDVMERTGLLEKVGIDRIFGNVDIAVRNLYHRTHFGGDEARCPLIELVPIGLPVSDQVAEALAASPVMQPPPSNIPGRGEQS